MNPTSEVHYVASVAPIAVREDFMLASLALRDHDFLTASPQDRHRRRGFHLVFLPSMRLCIANQSYSFLYRVDSVSDLTHNLIPLTTFPSGKS